MTCSRCHNTDPNCYVCHEKPEEPEPEPFLVDPYEEEIDRLLTENPEPE
jgi:hypothetical protein